jgi:DNA primase catalytic core
MREKAARILALVNIVDIVKNYIPLEKFGENYRSKCPFHHDTDPSLSVSSKLGIFKCFGAGCGVGGNAAIFISKYEDITYAQALAILAEKIGRADLAPNFKKREFNDVFEVNDLVLELYKRVLFTKDSVSEKARGALRDRRITQETAKLFDLGYSPNSWTWLVDQIPNPEAIFNAGLIVKTDAGHYRDFFKNRIIFPIYHKQKLIGFIGRTLGVSKKIPKYLNSKDADWFKKSRMMYGWHINGKAVKSQKHIVIVEGQFDVLQLYQRGVQNAVAVSGSYFGAEQAKLFSHYINRATIFSDGDAAGSAASLRIAEFLVERSIDVNIIHVDGKDPDDCARYKHRFDWKKLNNKYSFTLAEYAFKNGGIEEALKRISSYKTKLKLSRALGELSELSGYDEKHLERWLTDYKKSPMTGINISTPTTQLKLSEELVLISAINGKIDLNPYLRKKIEPKLLELIENNSDGYIQELAKNSKYATRLHMLGNLKDKRKYIDDLLVKINLTFMQKDVKDFKNKYEETQDSKYLSNIQKMVQRINKLKIKVRHGKSYESRYKENNSSQV